MCFQSANLATMRRHAEQIFRAGLRAVEPHAAIMRCGDLQEKDSCHLFEELGDLFKTGPTNTNVMDLRILLIV